MPRAALAGRYRGRCRYEKRLCLFNSPQLGEWALGLAPEGDKSPVSCRFHLGDPYSAVVAPPIAVIIPGHQAEKFIAEAVESALAQNFALP